MTSIFAGLGGFGGRFDGDLGSKIDTLLSGKKSSKDKVEDFLRSELRVDPNALPMSRKAALEFLKSFCEATAANDNQITFKGSSLGLDEVILMEYDHSTDEYAPVPVSNKNPAMHDLYRAYTALLKTQKVEDDKESYSCTVRTHWSGSEDIWDPIEVPNIDPLTYPSGTTLRLTHLKSNEHVYVRIGGLLSDHGVCDAKTMMPVAFDVSLMVVTEVL